MKRLSEVEVDQEAVTEMVESAKAPTLARVVVRSALVFAVTLMGAIALMAMVGGEPWTGFAIALLIAVGTAWSMSRSYGGMAPADAADRIQEEWGQLEGAGWRLRFLKVGLTMGVAIGLPVGAILAFGSPAEELPAASRSLTVLALVGLTMAWTIPAAYLIRLISRRSLRPYIR